MNKKKILSVLCAATMVSSLFSSMIVANAETTPVFSYTDGSTASWTSVGSHTGATETVQDENSDSYIKISSTGSGVYDYAYTLPAEAQLSDNYVIDFDTMIHTGNGMGRLARHLQIAFTGAAPTKDTRDFADPDFLTAVGQKLGVSTWNTAAELGQTYVSDIALSLTSRVELLGNIVINQDGTEPLSVEDGDANIGYDKWVRVRAQIEDGVATVTIIDSAENKILDEAQFLVTAEKLTAIHVMPNRGDNEGVFDPYIYGQGYATLDNIFVYDISTGAAPVLTAEGLRGDAVKEEPVYAPETTPAPDMKVVGENNFNDAAKGRLMLMGPEQADYTDFDGLALNIGTRSEANGLTNWTVTENPTDYKDRYLSAISGTFSNGNRGPRMMFTPVASETNAIGVTFAARLHSNLTDAIPAEIVFSGSNSVSGKNELRDVMAKVTADATAPTCYVLEGATAEVANNEWFIVEMTVDTTNNCIITVNGEQIYSGIVPVTNAEGKQVATNTLPMISFRSGKADEYDASNTSVDLDNIVVYSTNGSSNEVKPEVSMSYADSTVTITSNTDMPATIFVASYTDGKLTSVTPYEVTLSSTAAVTQAVVAKAGDKIMLWDNLTNITPLTAASTAAE